MNKKEEDDKTSKINKYNKSDLICDGNHNFYKYHDIKRFNSIPFKSKYSFLFEFYYDLETFGCLYPLKEHKKTPKKLNVYDAASKLYHELLEFYLDEYYDFPNARKSRMDRKCGPINLLLDAYDYTKWFKKRRLRISWFTNHTGTRRWWKIRKRRDTDSNLNSNISKLLLGQMKAGNNSYKLKMKSGKYYIFCISIVKQSKNFTKV